MVDNKHTISQEKNGEPLLSLLPKVDHEVPSPVCATLEIEYAMAFYKTLSVEEATGKWRPLALVYRSDPQVAPKWYHIKICRDSCVVRPYGEQCEFFLFFSIFFISFFLYT